MYVCYCHETPNSLVSHPIASDAPSVWVTYVHVRMYAHTYVYMCVCASLLATVELVVFLASNMCTWCWCSL